MEVDNCLAIGIAIKITSKGPKKRKGNQPPSPHDKYRIKIEKWKEAGLDRESWSRCEKYKAFPLSAFKPHRKRGEIHPDDFANISSIYYDLTS